MTVAAPVANPARRLPAAALSVLLAVSAIPALERSEPHPPSTGLRPTPRERVVSVWAGLAETGASSAEVTHAGGSAIGSAADLGTFVLLGGRLEYFPSVSGRLSKHFGFGVDVTAMAGEADMEIRRTLPAEEVSLGAAVIAPSLVVRLPGRTRWEGYVGLGFTLIWGAVLSDVGVTGYDDEAGDTEIALGPSLYAGLRRSGSAGWFFMMEGRYQGGENDFELRDSLSKVHLEWRTTQIVFGSGYRF